MINTIVHYVNFYYPENLVKTSLIYRYLYEVYF